MKIQLAATFLVLGAVAVHIREGDDQIQADEDYRDGYTLGLEDAEDYAEEIEELSDDFLWGYVDGVTDGLFPGWNEEQEGAAPEIILPEGVTLNQAYEQCQKEDNIEKGDCAKLVHYCKTAEGDVYAAQEA